MIHDNGVSNKSGNRPFEDVMRATMSRRNVLIRGAALSATGFLSALAGNKAFVQSATAATTTESAFGAGELGSSTAVAQRADLIHFPFLPPSESVGPSVGISSEYQYEVIIPWGEALELGVGPSYDGDPVNRPTAATQIEQIGIGHDGMWFFPMGGTSNDHGMLAINHEFGTNFHVLGKDDPESLEEVRTSQHAHGVSVVELRKTRGKWRNIPSPNARRIHVNTPMAFSGPVVGSTFLETPAGNPPKGTVNNCSNGYTPWGTYLTCEENFNGYFGATKEDWTPTPEQERYGFTSTGFGYGWYNFDPRFDLSNPDYTNEENRFGWVVEIDPMDGSQMPVKRTALGRFKHEGVAFAEGKGGRFVCYMGDDERFDYLYKYVSAYGWRQMLARGVSPLDEGTLYVAKFNDDSTGEWLPLTIENPVLREQFSSQAEVLTYVRLAADALGATPMDRPEWTSVGPQNIAYCSLTNNSQRTEPNPANPLVPNPDGHIIRWRDGDDLLSDRFTWDIFIFSQDTHSDEEAAFGSPDGIWADPEGRLFIETDGDQPTVEGFELNNQMLVANTITGEVRRLLSGPADCEVTGITVTPDRRTMFINIQHPGDGDPTVTNFPASQGSGKIPRDCTLVLTRKDGGIVGS